MIGARSERGATSLEYAGFIAVAALVAATVFLGVGGGNNALGRGVTEAICKIFTLGQGTCAVPVNAQERIPTEPCVINSSGHEAAVTGALAVEVGANERWLVEQLSDGTYRVTRGTGTEVSAEAGVGFDVTGTWDDREYGAEASASAGAGVSFGEGEVYNLPNEQAVQDLLYAHFADIAMDSVVGDETFGVPFTDWEVTNPIRWGTDQVGGAVGLHGLPEADETYFEAGASANAAASATFIAANVDAQAGVQALLGTKIDKDGSTTTYYSALINGGINAGTWGGNGTGDTVYAEAAASGQLDAGIAIERDAQGQVTAITVKYGMQGEAYAGEDEPGGGQRSEHTVTLPVKTAADRQVAADFLDGLNMGPVPGLPGYVPNPTVGQMPRDPLATATATVDFVRAVQDHGYLTRQNFTTDDGSYGFDFDAKLIAELGLGLEVTTSELQTTGGEYFNGVSWVPWEACSA